MIKRGGGRVGVRDKERERGKLAGDTSRDYAAHCSNKRV